MPREIVLVFIVSCIIALFLGVLIGIIFKKNRDEKTVGSAEQKAKNLILDAEKKAETLQKEKLKEAKEDADRRRNEAE
jgi:ribonuclease Y